MQTFDTTQGNMSHAAGSNLTELCCALQFVDASNPNGPELYGSVNTSTSPTTISWVPLDVPELQTTIIGAA